MGYNKSRDTTKRLARLGNFKKQPFSCRRAVVVFYLRILYKITRSNTNRIKYPISTTPHLLGVANRSRISLLCYYILNSVFRAIAQYNFDPYFDPLQLEKQ